MPSTSGYSAIDRLFHRLALSSRVAGELFFDVENVMHGRDCQDVRDGAHVIVSGLARAGTTILMRMLHDAGSFASLTYRDMPLVMAPNLWHGVVKRFQKSSERTERAHGDGVMVDFDSPEALEEVFWRTFCGPDYIGSRVLRPMRASQEVIDHYRRYVSLILKRHNRSRYLAKNNNSTVRFPSIVKAFPNATIIVPFRHPIAQASSLLAQHRNFIKRHEQDSFSRCYMDWLAHYEFGTNHRRFVFDAAERGEFEDPLNVSYWLDLWLDFYRYAIQQAEILGHSIMFFSYERLVSDPSTVRERLFDRLGLEPSAPLEVRQRLVGLSLPAMGDRPDLQATYEDLTARADRALSMP